MGSQIISPAGAVVPDRSQPLSGNPNNIALISYVGSNGPQRIDVNIGGIGNATGYTAAAVAIGAGDGRIGISAHKQLRIFVSAGSAPALTNAIKTGRFQ